MYVWTYRRNRTTRRHGALAKGSSSSLRILLCWTHSFTRNSKDGMSFWGSFNRFFNMIHISRISLSIYRCRISIRTDGRHGGDENVFNRWFSKTLDRHMVWPPHGIEEFSLRSTSTTMQFPLWCWTWTRFVFPYIWYPTLPFATILILTLCLFSLCEFYRRTKNQSTLCQRSERSASRHALVP